MHLLQFCKFQNITSVWLLAIICYVLPYSICLAQESPANPKKTGGLNTSVVAIVDQDQDGLSDFHERHKYLTDPTKPDTDGDGIPDGDWKERREYQYTIRSVVHVMRPVTIEYLNDDYQDARVLDETEQYVELEVFHYPFNTVASTIKPDDNWRETARQMQEWLRPGPSSNWTPEMQKEMKQELAEDGIDIDKLNDQQVVEKVSKWLLQRAEYVDGFTGFVTAWDKDGQPYIPEGLDEGAKRELEKSGRTMQEQWEREVSAKGMYKNKTRGSCTSSAIYLNGCMRAAGIPTRTVLCIPIIDANDDREFQLVQQLKAPGVRQHLMSSLRKLKGSWASHTFNEVYVGGHWHRLNYDHLGQGIYDKQLFGLITHIGTFRDWADAKFYETVGKRQKTERPNDIFGNANPYSTIALRDEVGVHCQVELPQPNEEMIVVDQVFWTDDEALPESIRENCKSRGRFGFIAKLSGVEGMSEFNSFLEMADLRVFMEPKSGDSPSLKIGFDRGCFWIDNRATYIYIPFGGGDKRDLVQEVEYEFRPRNQTEGVGWKLKSEITISRNRSIPEFSQD